MKFYDACGILIGGDVEASRGNSNYSCITKINISDLYTESQTNLDFIQEVIEKKAKEIQDSLDVINYKLEIYEEKCEPITMEMVNKWKNKK